MLLQNLTRRKFLFALRQRFEFIDDFLQSKMLGETQRPATERRETGSQNHSVVRVLWRIDHFLFHTTCGLIHHKKDKPQRQVIPSGVEGSRRVTFRFCHGVPRLRFASLGMTGAFTPLYERLVRLLYLALVFVKTSTRFSPEHLSVAQPQQNSRSVIASAVSFLKRVSNIN